MNSWHSAIGTTPFFLMHGYHPEIRWEFEDDSLRGKVPTANKRVQQLQRLRDETAERLERAKDAYSKHYNKKHLPKSYNVGDLVMLATKNLKQKRPSKKLSHKFIGPFKIIDKVGAQAYRLLLPSTYRIHNTFHISLLEPYHLREGDEKAENFMQAPELIDDDEFWEVEEIVDKLATKKEIWYKVKWTGWGEEYDQWVKDKELASAQKRIDEFNAQAEKRRNTHSQSPEVPPPTRKKRKQRK